MPSSAGSRVTATRTATATTAAAARPIERSSGMPTTDSPASAVITVSPANTTADPAVPTARPAACGPEPGDDEQGGVDAYGEAEHQCQDEAVGVDVDELRCDRDPRQTDDHAGDRGEQRQSGGEQRPEGDDQDQRGDQHPDALGRSVL